MASFWSDYLKDKVLNHMRGIATWTPAATSFFQLMNNAPTPAGGGAPVPVLPRLEVNNSSTSWNAASAGMITNKNLLEFASAAPVDLGTVVGIAEYDAATGGHLLSYGDLSVPKTITAGMAFQILAGNGQFSYIDNVPPI